MQVQAYSNNQVDFGRRKKAKKTGTSSTPNTPPIKSEELGSTSKKWAIQLKNKIDGYTNNTKAFFEKYVPEIFQKAGKFSAKVALGTTAALATVGTLALALNKLTPKHYAEKIKETYQD